jgi:PAS domain S-box-containing protein
MADAHPAPFGPRRLLPNMYRDLYATMRDGILVLDGGLRVLYANPAAEAILGQAVAEQAGRPVQDVLPVAPAALEQCLAGGQLIEVSLPGAGGDGTFEIYAAPLTGVGGRGQDRLLVLHNITRRALAQRASQEMAALYKQSEEKYRYLVENINETIFTTTLDGDFTFLSPGVEQLAGPAYEQLIGRSYRDFIHPDDLEEVEIGIDRVLAGELRSLEFRTARTAGHVRYVRIYVRTILREGEPDGFLGVAVDVTARRLAEEALERRAAQLALLNFIGEQLAATMELEQALLSAVQLIQQHFGYYHVAIFLPNWARKELVLRSASGVLSEPYAGPHHRLGFGQGMVGWAAEHQCTLLTNDVRLEPRYTNLYPDLKRTRSELVVPILIGDELAGVLDVQSPEFNAFDDNDVRVMKTVADQIAIAMVNARLYEQVRRQLAERERQENALRVQRDLLMRLSSASSLDELLRSAAETLREELNASVAALWLVDWAGFSARQAAGAGYAGTPQPPVALDLGILGWVARNGQPALIPNLSQEAPQPGLQPGTASVLCVPLLQEAQVFGAISLESSAVAAFSQDDLRLLVTLSNSLVVLIERARLFEAVEQARRELEDRAAELEKANARLRSLDRLKSQFLANISHELRTPLNSIIGFSEVLADGLAGTINGEQTEYLQDILDSSRHLLALINNLLDFSKMEAGRLALELTTFTVSDLFEDLRRAFSPLVEKKRQRLVFEQAEGLPALTADPLRIKQVFLNLLSNANKFTPAGGSITTACRLYGPDRLLFSVHDSGIGIRPADHALIFEEFRQADGSLTREAEGTGLGLTISKRIVEQHGGQIWVESELQQGATFYVLLPLAPRPPAEADGWSAPGPA